jgi:sugar lactone lactonase YvrE
VILAGLVALMCSFGTGAAGAVALNPGDFILATHPLQTTGPCQIVRLDHASFTPTVISSGPLVTYAWHIAVDLRGRILVTDFYAGIVVVDAATGAQSVFASTSSLGGSPAGIVATTDGRIYVSFSNPGRIVRLDPISGAPSPVTSGDLLSYPLGMAMGPDGMLYIAENVLPLRGSIVKVDPVSGSEALVAASDQFIYPFDIAVSNGVAWTLQMGFNDGRGGCFDETTLSDGTTVRSTLSTHCRAKGIAIASDGMIAYSDCIPDNFVCSTLITGRSGDGTILTGIGGPLAVVPDRVTPVKTSSWGRLKLLYR